MNPNLINQYKIKFIKSEFFLRAWEASSRRNKIYVDDNSDDKRRTVLQNKIESCIDNFILPYTENEFVDDSFHFMNLKRLQEKIEEFDSENILIHPVKISFVQKLLNMILKHYWCMDWTKTPPHFPIDKINLNSIKRTNVNWTELKELNEYENEISAFKNYLIENQIHNSLAVWELKNWTRNKN